MALGFAGFLKALFPELPERPTAVTAIVVLTLVNLRGIKKAGRLNAIIVLVALVGLAGFLVAMLPRFELAHFRLFASKGWGAALEAEALLFFATQLETPALWRML